MSFLHKEYIDLIAILLSNGKQVGPVGEFLRLDNKMDRVILRHDVDRRPTKALQMARLECQLGIKSTYYFRASRHGAFPVGVIASIAALGHEVGYHYEDLSRCRGHINTALLQFERNITELREIAICETISMHGAPLSAIDNQSLIGSMDLDAYGLLGDAVSSIEPYRPVYLTDTGGKWSSDTANLRDHVGMRWPSSALPDAPRAFTAYISCTRLPLYISTHPERWSTRRGSFIYARLFDLTANGIKRLIKKRRNME